MHASRRLDDATFILSADGGLYIHVHDRSALAQASKRFAPSELLPLRDWLFKSAEWSPDTIPWSSLATIAYSHDDGLIHLGSRLGDATYDPQSDESLARLVRKLKSLAPIPRGLAEEAPPLPLPTPAQLAARTIFKRAVVAKGSGSSGGSRSSSGGSKPQSASYTASKARLAALMAKLGPPKP